MKKYKVYGIGNALVDTEIQVGDGELTAMGVEKGVMTLADEERQRELSDHLRGHLVAAHRASGGSAANSMIALARFGSPAYYCCKVAADDNGDFYIADLEAAKVAHNLRGNRQSGTTGRCLVLVSPDAERSMISFLGISSALAFEDVEPAAIRESEWVYIEGYLVTAPASCAAAIRTREIAEEYGVKTALSFSDPGMVEHFRDGMEGVLGNASIDLLFCNEQEALGWARCKDVRQAAEALKQIARRFAITLGARGALAYDGSRLLEVESSPVKAVDTNGAGDMFAGAFLHALNSGRDFADCVRFANLAAAKVVSRFGPRLSASEHDELMTEFF